MDEAALRSCAPEPHEITQKQAAAKEKPGGVVSQGPPQCRPDELIWVDITDPGEAELDLIGHRFNVHPMVMEDIRSREDRPKLHDYKDYLYIIFHAVSTPPREAGSTVTGGDRFELKLCEIDCVVGSDYVITLHPEPVAPFDELAERWQQHPELMAGGTAHLLYELMDEVLDEYFPLLDSLDERIDEFEDRLFTNFQGGLSSDIFSLKRSLLQIRRVAGPMRDVINTLLRHNAENGGQHFAYFQDLYDHAVRIVDMIDTFRDILAGALDAYLAVESNRMNAVMKTLTATSIILLIPTLIAGIYGMNFDNMPELHNPHGYQVVMGLMALMMVGLFVYFKRKEWL